MGRRQVSKRPRPKVPALCYWCNLRKATTVDHVIPLARGGANSRMNKAGCCSLCNNRKGDMTPVEFREYLETHVYPASYVEYRRRVDPRWRSRKDGPRDS